jgi:gamma-glutamyl hercynylcysteine S-oxide synthase
VREWMAGTLRPYPGHAGASPGQSCHDAGFGPGAPRALRGASFATHPRLRDPKARHAAAPDRDGGFHGFRSCAV